MDILLLIFTVSFWQFTTSLECYTCSVGEQDIDTTCIDGPDKLGIQGRTDCNKKFCTAIRQEYKDPQGKVASMYRGCEDKPLHMNTISEDATYRFYFLACQDRLCNGGSGKASDGDPSAKALGDKSTIFAPGTSKGSVVGPTSAMLMLVSFIICLIRYC